MIDDEIVRIIACWASREHHLEAIYLFGSRAKGLERPDSDIDLAIIVTGDNGAAMDYWCHNAERLSASLQALIPYKLDLQLASDDDTVVMPAVREHGVILFRPMFNDFDDTGDPSSAFQEWSTAEDEVAWRNL